MKISAMIFAAGLGTRLFPLTAEKPKALVEIEAKTLLERAIEKIIHAGITHIVVNTHHFSKQIADFLNIHHFEAEIIISDESEKLLDTAGGLKYAESHFQNSDHILLYNVDILSSIDLSQMLEAHLHQNALATIAVRNRATKRYFIFEKESLQLGGWKNIETCEEKLIKKMNNPIDLAFSGIHYVKRDILNFIPSAKKKSITPLYLELAAQHPIYGYWHQNDDWMDVGKYDELIKIYGNNIK